MIIYLGNQLTTYPQVVRLYICPEEITYLYIFRLYIFPGEITYLYIFRSYICPGEAQTGSQTAAPARAPASQDDPTQTRSTGLRPRSPPRDRRPPPAMTSPLSLVSVVAG